MSKTGFDYIIIGGGSAGCVFANRLSANPQAQVLLLEAGGKDSSPFIHMPAGIGRVKDNPKTDWCFETTPQAGLDGRNIPIPRGKTLGGSSAINAMVYIRGQRQDYDAWAEAGNEGWSYDDALPCFIRSERNTRDQIDTRFHGLNGPLTVSDLIEPHMLSEAFVASAVEAGLPLNSDFNGDKQEGAGLYQVTQANAKRCSAAAAYLRPVEDRPNLTIETRAHVVGLKREGARISSVLYRQNGVQKRVDAAGEVILSAGAIGSPQILMLSGIGRAEDLAKHNIKCWHELPGVGQNLFDHLNLSVSMHTKEPISLAGVGRGLKGAKAGLQYLWDKSGPCTTNGAEAGGFYCSPFSKGRPDIQMHFIPLMLGKGMTDTGAHGITLHACNLRPTDMGEITLASADPMDAPLIDNRFLQTEGNIDVMREGISIAREILHSGPMAELLRDEHWPGADTQSKTQLDAFIRSTCETEYHPVGTCRMGKDDMAVVDDRLRVHGIENLRVADASIMPYIISGNTNAPSMMIAEKAADLALQGVAAV